LIKNPRQQRLGFFFAGYLLTKQLKNGFIVASEVDLLDVGELINLSNTSAVQIGRVFFLNL
jgi:hypothetical protein